MKNNKTTIYICFRPFQGEWLLRNQTVLNSIKWQNVRDINVKFIHWPDETSTAAYAGNHGYKTVEVPWFQHYLFPGDLRSFKQMFETILTDCETENFIYINGDIILGPGILNWLEVNMESQALYSLPRHNWNFTEEVTSPAVYNHVFNQAIPEAWTAIDLFACKTESALKDLLPVPPFLLTAGSMDSWIVIRTGECGWRRNLVPTENFSMLHIEHPFSHPLKAPYASPEKFAKWAFNCGVMAAATEKTPIMFKKDATLGCFAGAEKAKAVVDSYAKDYHNSNH